MHLGASILRTALALNTTIKSFSRESRSTVVVGKKTIKNVQVSDGKKGEKQFIREAVEETTNELGAKTVRYTFEPIGFPASAKLQLKGTVTTSEEGLAARRLRRRETSPSSSA